MTGPAARVHLPWDRIRTDGRFPDPAWAFSRLDPDGPVHPVSGLPLHFGGRGCPPPGIRTRLVFAGPEGARVRWTRDRVDPVFHCPGRHTCDLLLADVTLPESIPDDYQDAARELAGWLPEPVSTLLENALLQDAELGFLQCLEAPEACRVEAVSRGMIGPLWSAAAAPESLARWFADHPDAWVLHLPTDEVERSPGPCVDDDPLAPLFGDGGPLAARMARLRLDVPYRVIRQRRAVFSGPPGLGEELSRLLPGLLPVPLETGDR